MIDISEIIATWPVNNGWRVSPGVDWCSKGSCLKVGNGAVIGSRACIGHRVTLGDRATIGDLASVGNHATVGDHAFIGKGATVGRRAFIGDDARIGDCARFIHDLGVADGHRTVLCAVGDVAYIGAGCRWFTLRQAVLHCRHHPYDRRRAMALIGAAATLADLEGLQGG